jgi:hypothetical protein
MNNGVPEKPYQPRPNWNPQSKKKMRKAMTCSKTRVQRKENEAEEAVYEVNHNEYVNFYETTLREKEKENEMKNKRKNECLVTMHDKMHSYL